MPIAFIMHCQVSSFRSSNRVGKIFDLCDFDHQIFEYPCLLIDIKAEVENVIKMGRKLVESSEVSDMNQKELLTSKIDSLKEEFNLTGKNVSEAQSNLESSLKLMKKFEAVSSSLESWIELTTKQTVSFESEGSNIKTLSDFLSVTYLDAAKFKRSYLELYKIFEDISALVSTKTIVADLKTHIQKLETEWTTMEKKIKFQYSKFGPDVALESTFPGEINIQLKAR